MNLASLKRGVVFATASFCLLLFISVLLYVFNGSIPEIFYQLMGFSLGMGVLFFIHFWSDRKNQAEPFEMILFTLLKFELVFSLISFVFLVFGTFDWWKVLLVFLSAQLIHLMIYLSNMFLFDERSSGRINKTSGEILSSSIQKGACPEHQGSDSPDD